jgi:hypothetical protein
VRRSTDLIAVLCSVSIDKPLESAKQAGSCIEDNLNRDFCHLSENRTTVCFKCSQQPSAFTIVWYSARFIENKEKP